MSNLKRGIIVSCQAVEGEVFHNLNAMKYFAQAAIEGGAVAIRSLSDEIVDIKKHNNNVVVIGLDKKEYNDSEVYITPTIKEVKELIETGCEVIALDATNRIRPNGETLEELVIYIRNNSNCEIMADIATLDDALRAEELGLEYISTTLRGYTNETKDILIPDLGFIKELTNKISKSKVIVEGGIWEGTQLEMISKLNPYAVVIGTSITRPKNITEYFKNRLNLI